MYTSAAQYNSPPKYPVTVICGGIDGASIGSDILSKIVAGLVAYRGNITCKVNGPTNISETSEGWRWQVIAFTSARCFKYFSLICYNSVFYFVNIILSNKLIQHS